MVAGTLSVSDQCDFDTYGNIFSFAGIPCSERLYSDEMTDRITGRRYLRARYYDPATSRFNRLDPFAGSTSDPQSLHKYLYAHANPVMGVDPSGTRGLLVEIGIAATLTAFVFELTVIAIHNHASIQASVGQRQTTGNGGPDVTSELFRIRDAIFDYSKNLEPEDYTKFKRSIWESPAGSWDITELSTQRLVTSKGYSELDNGMKTVTVDGKVYYDPEVNYWIYGSWARAAGISKETMLAAIYGYRRFVFQDEGYPDYDSSIGGRQAWAVAGYYGVIAYAHDAAIDGAIPSKEVSGPLDWQIQCEPEAIGDVKGYAWPK